MVLGIVGRRRGFQQLESTFNTPIDPAALLYTLHHALQEGSKRADIISNSWGISLFVYDITGFGYDYASMLENALSTPGFLDDEFPGILIVHAAGNGGGGYGTVTSSGVASLPLTVGASTSTHVYSILFGFGYFTYDEVVGWSARGPTPTGEVKPDIVNVGAYGYTAAPVGMDYTIFGGTSYATPLTAGAAALIYSAFYSHRVINVDPMLVKSILMNTADPLKYSAFDQGAGRVNAYRAVNMTLYYAFGGAVPSEEFSITNSDIFNNLKDKYARIWYWMMSDYIPYQLYYWYFDFLFVPNPTFPVHELANEYHYGIYVNDIPQGGSKSFSLEINNLN